MKTLSAFLLFLVFFTSESLGQLYQGRVLNDNQEPVPFANVYYQGSTIGTSSNLDGDFSLDINAHYTQIQISAVGYEKKNLSVQNFKTSQRLSVVLKPLAIKLAAVEINASKRDPAYAIMRKAIKKRKFHLQQVKHYKAEAYLKSSIHLTEIPAYIRKMADSTEVPDSADLGLMFLSEAVNRFEFEAPNRIEEEMLASKVSGTAMGMGGFSWNRTRDLLINFYERDLHFAGNRPLISPLSGQAFAYYNFKYLGEFYDNGFTVNKIKIWPKRKIDPCFNGYIYIVEDLWCIHSLDLKIDKSVNIEYTDSIQLKQNFQNLDTTLFMPISVNMDWYFSIMGIKAQYYALGQISKIEILDEPIPEVKSDKKNRNLLFTVKAEAQEKEQMYWMENRPVELTEDETKNYIKGDSIKDRISSPAYLDSLDRVRNKLSLSDVLLNGYRYHVRKDSFKIFVPPVLNVFQFNSVDGMIFELKPFLEWENKLGYDRLRPKWRYGVASGHFDAAVDFEKQFNKMAYDQLYVHGGLYTEQLNPVESITPDLNSYYNLFDKRNLAQYYRKAYAGIAYEREVRNGVRGRVGLDYAYRYNLFNQSDFSTKKNKDKAFKPNLAAIQNTDQSAMVVLATEWKFQINNKYELYPNRKYNLGSKWPELTLGARWSPNYFTQLYARVEKQLALGLVGLLRLYASGGGFVESENLNFVDYQHFKGNQTLFGHPESYAFNLLPYYDFSAQDRYLHLAATHNFNGFIMNKLPLLRKLKLTSFASLRFLYSDGREYMELGYGVSNVLKVLRLEFVSSYYQNKFSAPQLRIGFTLLN